MAQLTIKIHLIKTLTVMCEGTNEEECLDDIADNERLEEFDLMSEIYSDCITVLEADYDEPEEEEVEDEDEDESSESDLPPTT